MQRAWWRAPGGLGAASARRRRGADGAGGRIFVLEHGWTTAHRALSSLRVREAGAPSSGPVDHGAAVLGLLGAQGAPARGVDEWVLIGCGQDVERALALALREARPGDTVLLQAQARLADQAGVPWPLGAAWKAPEGVVVVLPAGNGGVDLDRVDHPGVGEALVVGACSARVPHTPLPRSCRGRLIDTWAWGERLVAPDPGWTGAHHDRWTGSFGGTSGASALITSLIASVQGVRRARGLAPWDSAAWRTHLRDLQMGTPVVFGGSIVGLQPDLSRLLERVDAEPPPAP